MVVCFAAASFQGDAHDEIDRVGSEKEEYLQASQTTTTIGRSS
jgi:hypothetical protein